MGIKTILFMMMALVGMQACEDKLTGLADGQLVLHEGESYKTDDFSLSLVNIDESRCPKGVECIWAGQAVTRLTIESSTDDTASLCIGACGQSDTLVFQGDSTSYRLVLQQVNPYPIYGEKAPKKTAVFELSVLE